jgi:hypothetical protein
VCIIDRPNIAIHNARRNAAGATVLARRHAMRCLKTARICSLYGKAHPIQVDRIRR